MMNQCIWKTDLWQMMIAVSGGSDRLAVCKALEAVGMLDLMDVCVSGEPNSVYVARSDSNVPMFVVDADGALKHPAEWAAETRETVDVDDMTNDTKRFINKIAQLLTVG